MEPGSEWLYHICRPFEGSPGSGLPGGDENPDDDQPVEGTPEPTDPAETLDEPLVDPTGNGSTDPVDVAGPPSDDSIPIEEPIDPVADPQ